jgi:hypothetical protein
VTDAADRLIAAIEEFDRVAEEVTAEEALEVVDEATLQVFWQRWPHVSSWAGGLWRRLNETLADAAMPADDSEFHEVGGEGG